jgi:hypothetical protein
VAVNAENAEDYGEFEHAIIANYQPITAIEYQSVMRLASLLWRLRRTVAIESGLFQIEGHIIRNRRRKLLESSQQQGDRDAVDQHDLLPRSPLQASSRPMPAA